MRLQTILCCLSAACTLPIGIAGPAAPASVLDLVKTADVIVAGVVQGTVVNGNLTLTIAVDRSIKGNISACGTITASWTSSRGERYVQISPEHALCFIVNSSGGTGKILPVVNGDAVLHDLYFRLPNQPPPRPLSQATSLSSLDKMLVEITWARESNVPNLFDLVTIFRETRSQILLDAFNVFAQSSFQDIALLGLRGQLAVGNPAAIAAIQAQQSTLLVAPGGRSVTDEIRYHFTSTDANAVNQLGSLAVSAAAPAELKLAAASSLAKAHTKGSLSYLAQLLDSPDPMLQSCAVGGLASFANNVPVGSHEPTAGPWPYRNDDTIAHSVFDAGLIQSNKAYYIAFWKDWWVNNRAALVQ
jgi:hypothetical protein